MLNAGVGLIFFVLLAGAVLFNSQSISAVLSEIFGAIPDVNAAEIVAPILVALICLMSGMNMFSASALSLEGSGLWILKSTPVASKDILIAKTVPHILLCAPIASVVGLVFAIATAAPIYAYVFYIVTPFLVNVLFAFVGILLNIAFPKFDYINEVQVVKQSMPVFIMMLSSVLFGLLLVGISFVIAIMGSPIIASVITLMLVLGLSVGLYFCITGPAARKLDRM
jgi:ABC-2 type transport system permease protein